MRICYKFWLSSISKCCNIRETRWSSPPIVKPSNIMKPKHDEQTPEKSMLSLVCANQEKSIYLGKQVLNFTTYQSVTTLPTSTVSQRNIKCWYTVHRCDSNSFFRSQILENWLLVQTKYIFIKKMSKQKLNNFFYFHSLVMADDWDEVSIIKWSVELDT